MKETCSCEEYEGIKIVGSERIKVCVECDLPMPEHPKQIVIESPQPTRTWQEEDGITKTVRVYSQEEVDSLLSRQESELVQEIITMSYGIRTAEDADNFRSRIEALHT